MIRLSRLTDYAVTLLTQMVSEGKSLWAASDLAEKAGVPLPTVSKILKQLSKAGVVAAQRGAAGGYALTKAPQNISVASIIEAMDGPIALTDCAEGGDQDCRIQTICPMSGNWNKVNQAVRTALDAVSLADMMTSQHAPTCSPDKNNLLPARGEDAKTKAYDSKPVVFAGGANIAGPPLTPPASGRGTNFSSPQGERKKETTL